MPRRKSIAEEIAEVALVTPAREDYLEDDLEGAPLFSEDTIEDQPEENRSKRIRAETELGDEYLGEVTTRNEIFSESSASLNSELELDKDLSFTESELDEVEDSADGELYREFAKLQDDVGLSDLRERASRDKELGVKAKRDQQLWFKAVDLRLKLQKPLEIANTLPKLSYSDNSMASKYSLEHLCFCAQFVRRIKQLRLLCSSILDKFLNLGDKQTKKDVDHFEYSEDDELWTNLENQYAVLKEFSDRVLDRFHRQAMLQSGARTEKGILKRLHQGISAQVESMMKAPEKALVRSRVDPSNPETYIDYDFFHTLLKDSLGMKPTESVRRKTRKRTRQGEVSKKNEKLFSEIHEKLINFMTPIELDHPPFAKHLFQNLFNH